MMNTDLYWRLRVIVNLRGLSNTNVGWYRWMTVWDNGAQWDIATQGPIPTIDQINAVTQAEIDTAKDQELVAQCVRLADEVVARSVARIAWEEIKKCQVRNGQTLLDWDQFRDAIKLEIKSRIQNGS